MLKRLVTIACLLTLLAIGTVGAVDVKALPMQGDACSGLPESRLSDGALAKVVGANAAALPGAFLKPEAARLGPVLRYLPLGTVVKVSGQFKCSESGERWWPVSLENLKGWMTESSGVDYSLEPFSGEAPKPLASTIAPLLSCIRPELGAPAPTAESTESGTPVFRAVFGGADGSLQYSDNLGPTRTIQQFDPPPLSIDLSPDGSAALVITYNGLYWVDLVTGQLVLVADSTTFGLYESMWLTRVVWLPDGTSAALEIKDTTDDVTTYSIWSISVNGIGQPFRADTGKQPANSIRRTPQRDRVILLSANDIAPYPGNNMDDPPAFLEYVPQFDEGDTRDFLAPALSWASDASGFYTYIPISDNAPPDDMVGGHLWFVPFKGQAKDLGQPPKVETSDYVIASPDGKALLLGSGTTWRIQNPETGDVLQKLPPVQYLFDWTPDSKGVVFTHSDGSIGYLGLGGETSSEYVPKAADNLYGIHWLPDGTTLYVVQGKKDQKLSFSIQRPGQEPVFMGIASTVDAYSAAVLPKAPGLGKVPQPCAR